MTPGERYAQDLRQKGLRQDAAQTRAIVHLDDLYHRLVVPSPSGFGERFGKLIGWSRPSRPVQGLYLWGGVGRGKTYLMDLLFDSLPFEEKLRIHFHRAMRRIHGELQSLAGKRNPLAMVAEHLASGARVLCLDEFLVADITDAMILSELLKALFARGVTLVATSNVAPKDLYRDGLQRRRFLPAIDLLERHCLVLQVDGCVDHRLRVLAQTGLYHWPLAPRADAALAASFEALAPHARRNCVTLEVEGRQISVRAESNDVIWFAFEAICDGPRSQLDYIEIAREYNTVFISGVPRFTSAQDDQARRFIMLVDLFYDRGVKLVLSAEVPIPELYAGERLAFEFRRTKSRLLEMQSRDYMMARRQRT